MPAFSCDTPLIGVKHSKSKSGFQPRAKKYSLKPCDVTACQEWLAKVEFLRPGVPDDDKAWEAIKRNWIAFLSATSETVVPGQNDTEEQLHSELAQPSKQRFAAGEAAFSSQQSNRTLDTIEAMVDRWPAPIWRLLNADDALRSGTAFETYACVRKSGMRRKVQAIWIGLVNFLVYTSEASLLTDMGLSRAYVDGDELTRDGLMNDLLVVRQMLDHISPDMVLTVPLDDAWVAIESFLASQLWQEKSTARNNAIVWWTAVLVRSGIETARGGTDYISRGRFTGNIMPMDLDIRARAAGLMHYAKVIGLQTSYRRLLRKDRDVIDNDMDQTSLSWLNDVDGHRKSGSSEDEDPLKGEAWAMIKRNLQKFIAMDSRHTPMYWVSMLEQLLGMQDADANG